MRENHSEYKTEEESVNDRIIGKRKIGQGHHENAGEQQRDASRKQRIRREPGKGCFLKPNCNYIMFQQPECDHYQTRR